MVKSLVDPDRFVLLASVVDWLAVSRGFGRSEPAWLIAEQRRIKTRMVQLRWTLSPDLGLPTEPFKVYRRPSLPAPSESEVAVETLVPHPSWRLHVLPFDAALVRARFRVVSGNAIVMALAQPNLFSAPIAVESFPSGTQTRLFAGPTIRALAVFGHAELRSVFAAPTTDVASLDSEWELVEIVGMPVDQVAWTGVLDHDQPQGPAGSRTDPVSAAFDRWRRGAPFYGWDPEMAPGESAPLWKLADPSALVEVAQRHVLPDIRTMLEEWLPHEQILFPTEHELSMENGSRNARAQRRPLVDLLYAVATDPLASLILGYGTAFKDVDLTQVDLADRVLRGEPRRSEFDFKVTAFWSKGLDGQSEPTELVALALAPDTAIRPPKPARFEARLRGVRAPDLPDGPFRMTAEIEWARPPQTAVARAVSYAAARRSLVTDETEPLLFKRAYDVALQTVGVSTSPDRLEQGLGPLAGDGGYMIASKPQPNILRYAAAHQDLFGVWSEWSTAPLSVSEPAIQQVTIISARLETQRPAAASACPTRLVLDFSWDWSARTPLAIEFRGRFYVQPKRDAAPTTWSIPAGLDRTFPGGGPPLVLTLDANGEVSGGSVLHLSDDGTEILSEVDEKGVVIQQNPSTAAGPRRYRLMLDGMSIDHGLAGHVGMAIWARGRERAGVQRLGSFRERPKVASSSDPRPPILVGLREDVMLASMPDGNGEHRVRIAWTPYPGAVGYFVYHAEESKIRAVNDLGDAPRGLTLSDRLAALRSAFQDNPDKRAFSRLNAKAQAELAYEAVLPRGTKEIHLYMVVGVGAGGIETEWPTSADPNAGKRLFAFAAPQLSVPAPPELEVARVLVKVPAPPVHRARVIMRARPGVTAAEIHLHRVRDPEAALDLDTMGPPIAKISGTTAQWTVTPHSGPAPGETQPLATISGLDPVRGSWKPVFYRAVAWSADIPERGIYGGRSRPSSVQQIVVPPADGPDISPITIGGPGGPMLQVAAQATIAAPIGSTPLGPHRIQVEALLSDAAGKLWPAILFPGSPAAAGAAIDNRIEAMDTTPAGNGSAIWRTTRSDGAEGFILNIRVVRPSFETSVRIRVQVTDPLGRAAEREALVPAASPLPEPNLSELHITPRSNDTSTLVFSTNIWGPELSLEGSYILNVRYRPTPFMTTEFLPGPQLSSRLPMASMRYWHPEDPIEFDLSEIPLRVFLFGGHVQIEGLLRGRHGSVTVTLTAPDGRVATARKRF